jgi:hypothetical protein
MLSTIRRYLRAFGLALKLTLRGQTLPLPVRERYPQLAAWWAGTVERIETVEQTAKASGVDMAALTIRVDKRDTSMATIIAAVRYHAEQEYPYLLRQDDPYNPITLSAINLNDRYLLMRLAEQVAEPVKAAVETLRTHLEELPT